MATKLLQPSMKDSQVTPLICRTMNIMKLQRMVPAGNRSRINTSRFCERPLWFRPITIIKVAEHSTSSGLVEDETLAQKKRELYQAVEGINKGIFGIPSVKKSEIESLIKQLESQNPTPDPTLELEKMAGCWRLVYSTISILGSKRTKLGLRDFISLDEFFQNIDISKSKAVNVIKFSARGLTLLSGQLSIEASFKIASTTRVGINFENSTITPDQLMNLFRKNYDLLLGIFNPEGWLEITYVDDSMRIGRDDKGNIFVLERFEDTMPKPKSTLKTHGKFCSRKQKEILLSEGYFCSQEKRNEQMKGGLAVKCKVVEFSVAMRSRSHDDASSTHVVSGEQVDGGLWQSGSVFWGWDAVVASSLCMSC